MKDCGLGYQGESVKFCVGYDKDEYRHQCCYDYHCSHLSSCKAYITTEHIAFVHA